MYTYNYCERALIKFDKVNSRLSRSVLFEQQVELFEISLDDVERNENEKEFFFKGNVTIEKYGYIDMY